jgi:hypothetical protein
MAKKIISKQTSIKYFAEKDTELTIQFLEGKLTQIQLAIEKTKLLQQAIQMHKEEIVDAWNGGDCAYFCSKKTDIEFTDGSEYYNEVYGGNNE